MVQLIPVRAYHPDPAKVDPSSVACPVYDVLNDADHARYDSMPYNAATFTSRPDSLDVPAFLQRAERKLEEAIQGGAFQRDETPSLYVYGIKYTPTPDVWETFPESQRRKGYLLLGVVGALDPAGREDGSIALHERTFPDRVEERVRLTDTTHMHFAPIMAGYTIEDHRVNDTLERALGLDRREMVLDGRERPLVETTIDGAVHRLWRLRDPEIVARIQALLKPVRVLILDGHHRFTAALTRRRSGKPDLPLAMLVEGGDRALLLLPWHRVLPARALTYDAFVRRAVPRFAEIGRSDGTPSVEGALERLRAIRGRGRRGFVAVGPEGMTTVTGDPSADEGRDYEMLHQILEDEMHIDPHDMTFVRSPREALRRIAEGGKDPGGVAFLIPPLTEGGVEHTTFELGKVMTQKSTMFLPKVAEGVIFAPEDRPPSVHEPD